MSDSLYKEELLDHYRHPRNKKTLTNAGFMAGHNNPSCGDRIVIEGIVNDNTIVDLGFNGVGCVISQAAASMLTELCIGKTVTEVLKLNKNDVCNLIGIHLGPTRLKCALLSLEVLQEGLRDYQNKQKTD